MSCMIPCVQVALSVILMVVIQNETGLIRALQIHFIALIHLT